MILFRLRRKRPATEGAERRGDFRETVKAGLTKEEFYLILLRPVFPQELLTDGAPGRVDQVNEWLE